MNYPEPRGVERGNADQTVECLLTVAERPLVVTIAGSRLGSLLDHPGRRLTRTFHGGMSASSLCTEGWG